MLQCGLKSAANNFIFHLLFAIMSLLEQMIEKFRQDRYAMLTGIEIIDVAPGYAKTKLVIEEKHLNAVDIVQGGVVFTLADFAFAVAGNCGEETVVSIEANISYMKPSRVGNTLYAEAKEIARSKSLVSYDIPVTDEQGNLICRFYGRAFVRR